MLTKMQKILPCYLSIIIILSSHLNEGKANLTKIDPQLISLLEKGEKANVVIFFVGGVQPALEKAATLRLNDRTQRNQAIIDALKDHSDASQEGVVNLLSARSSSGFQYYKQYWNSNKMFIKQANADTVKAVAENPKVLKIKKEIMGRIPTKQSLNQVDHCEKYMNMMTSWGLHVIKVEEAWKEMDGKKGEGVIVGTIDTGVRHTHEALRDNFIGVNYGWYDPLKKKPQPADEDGHGTHTLGTIVGTTGIGVAPGARWMTCVGCDKKECYGEALLDCIKFFACPTLPDGSEPDCSKAPHIVSNSWISERGDDYFNEDILRWRAMGIIPVFGIGNDGNYECGLAGAPAENFYVIGVGASNCLDQVDDFTSSGPASDGGIKPDLVAPGDSVYSAGIASDTAYRGMDGTSAATPHVAGVVALLMTRVRDLYFEEALDLLTQNTDWPLELSESPSYYCNSTKFPTDPKVVPNVLYGYGRLNALKAVQAQTREMLSKKK